MITIAGDIVTLNAFKSVKMKFGSFGEADPKIVEMTGEENYNIELSNNLLGKEMTEYGVLFEGGTKYVFKSISGIRTRIWITEEEAELIANDGDPIEAPPSDYKIEPERQGKLVWITGPAGLGKSTTGQMLSRKHGFVFYEGDCFWGLRNPYIPPNVPEASLAQLKQRKLVGEGVEARQEMVSKVNKEFLNLFGGKDYDEEVIHEGYKMMCANIRLGINITAKSAIYVYAFCECAIVQVREVQDGGRLGCVLCSDEQKDQRRRQVNCCELELGLVN